MSSRTETTLGYINKAVDNVRECCWNPLSKSIDVEKSSELIHYSGFIEAIYAGIPGQLLLKIARRHLSETQLNHENRR